MKMIVAAFLLLGFVAVSQQSDFNIYDLTALVDSTQADLEDVAHLISDAKTLCAVGDENINYINDFFLRQIKVTNEQQNELINIYGAQIKSLQHRVDDAIAREKGTASLASATVSTLHQQLFTFLNGSILERDDHQASEIQNLTWNLSKFKESFLDDLNSTITTLVESEEDNSNIIRLTVDFVDSQRCEYGLTYVNFGDYVVVDFKTEFDLPPKVTLAMPGFVAHLDRYKDGDYDTLDFSKEVGEVTTKNFHLQATDRSKGQVEGKYVVYSWMACQNIDTELTNFGHS